MSKTCPNCGVNSPDNAKFCIECAYDLKDVPINKEEPKPAEKSSNDSEDKGNVALGCIIIIVIVAIIIAVGFSVFGSGGDSNNETQPNILITFDEVYVSDYIGSSGQASYSYYVEGYFSEMPDDAEKYMVRVIFCDSNGRELASTTSRLSDFESSHQHNYAATIGSYYTKNYIDVDHVAVQIIRDNVVLNEFNATMNKNKLTTIPGSTNSNNSSR